MTLDEPVMTAVILEAASQAKGAEEDMETNLADKADADESKEPQQASPSLEIDADILASLLRQGLRILEAQDKERQQEADNAKADLEEEEEEGEELEPAPPGKILISCDLKGIASLIREGKAKKIVVMCGAGISVSAGIPDFRSPVTGLYSQLQKYRLDRPEDIFTLSFFKQNPMPFHTLARELFPGRFQPTPTHYFLKLLHEKGLLTRVYTQNIDSLESQAGLPSDLIVAAHGNFDSCHCLTCGEEHATAYFESAVLGGKETPSICRCSRHKCNGLVKPDIVFFGENLPDRFFSLQRDDIRSCDLLIVMGTSLVVYPFAGLCDVVAEEIPRLLINRELAGDFEDTLPLADNHRDAAFLGDCDDGCRELAALLGWSEDLARIINQASKVSRTYQEDKS